MIALTVRQPFAARIVRGTKAVENRSRPTQVRGLVVIHAGATLHDGIRTAVHPDREPWRQGDDLGTRAALVGVVRLVGSHSAETCGADCVEAGGIVAADGERNDMRAVHHWELRDPVEFASPIPRVRGALGLWHVEEHHRHLVRLAIDEAAGL